jgi:type II secretory pathway predicted ATPase ExeA
MLRLAEIIVAHGLKKKAFADAVGMKPAAFSRLINEGYWPRLQDADQLKQKIRFHLVWHGIPETEIKTAFDAATPNAVDNTSKQAEEIDMSKPILTQEARLALHLRDGVDLFEHDIHDWRDVFETEDTAYIRACMRTAATNGGFMAIISEPGGGKTTLANDLEDYCIAQKKKITFIRPDHISVERLTASGIYDAIIDDVSEGAERPKRTLEYKSRQAKRLLKEAHAEGRRHALILEEAHGLSSSTLKNLKRFWEIRSGHQAVLAIILIGQSELRRHLSDESWNTREVALRCQVLELKPLSPQQLYAYLAMKFEKSGLDVDSIFAGDAYAAIHARMQDGKNSFCYPQRANNMTVRIINKWAEIGGAALGKIGAELICGDLTLRREQ